MKVGKPFQRGDKGRQVITLVGKMAEKDGRR
jgi:hypothetical protein